jgi:ADP-heptose:LPS heptosyltransferase
MTHRLSFNPLLHATEVFRTLVEALNLRGDELPAFDLTPMRSDGTLPVFKPSDDETTEIECRLRELLGGDRIPPLILLNANCSDLLPLRRWPQDRYADLARRLIRHFADAAIVFTGAPNEAQGAGELVSEIGSSRCVNMAGRTTLRELLVLYCLADVLVTNDSGPAHFAALTPIDVVTLFGPETPAAFGARTPRSHILWSGIVCSPCVNAYNDRQSACTDNRCMQRISVDQVFDEVCRVFEPRREQGT